MSAFTTSEIEYLNGQRLARLATVGVNGEPHVVPVGFRYNPGTDTIDIGGLAIAGSKKYRDVQRDGRAAVVIDDVLPPWQPRGIEIRGKAETVSTGGKEINERFAPEVIRVTPGRIVAWGIEGDPYHPNSRTVNS
jgi:pyridoxamine 5'-phosphate oxidase family protein